MSQINDPNQECDNPNCGLRKYYHRLRDCDLGILMQQARRLNYPYGLPGDDDIKARAEMEKTDDGK